MRSEIIEGKYSSSTNIYSNELLINLLTNLIYQIPKRTGHGSYTIAGFDKNNKESWKSNGIIHIEFVNGTVQLHENAYTLYDNHGESF